MVRNGGAGEIRTHAQLALPDGFQVRSLEPLGYGARIQNAAVPYKTAAFVSEKRCYLRYKMLFALYECMPKDSADERRDADSIDRKAFIKNLAGSLLTRI